MNPEAPSAHPSLADLSKALTKLHKSLIDSERIGYEGSFGKIETPAEFLQLLMNDPWFAWLHPISEMIAVIDEAVDGKKPPTPAETNAFFQQVRLMLSPTEEGEGFGRHYFEALQRDPEVVLNHAAMGKLWRPGKS